MNIEVDSTAKCYASDEIIINSSIENVFEILSDINNWTKWQSNVSKSAIIGDIEPGKKFNWKAGGLNIKSQLHTVNPYEEIGWTGRIWWITAIHNWHLIKENGKTRVRVEESLKGIGSSGMRNALKEGISKSLKELKEIAERG